MKRVYYIMVKTGFYDLSHTTYEHHAPKVDSHQSQYDDTPNPESNFDFPLDHNCN